jgi:hypothetical protein
MTPEIKTQKKEVPVVKNNLRYLRDKDREMVEGIFRFHEVPGGTMSFVFRAYKEDQVERFDLTDGGRYKIPLGVARHLNKNCWYPVHTYEQDASGKSSMRIGQKVRRCSFQSLEFVDIDDITPVGDLVTVETVVNRPILD